MNDITTAPTVGALAIYEPGAMQAAFELGKLLSESSGMVPDALLGKVGVCVAVCLQARIWNMSPFGLASVAYKTPEGRVSYESKAVLAAAYSMGAIAQPLTFQPIGDWSRIAGRVVEKKGKNDKSYYAKDWTMEDEKGLGVKVIGIMPSGEIRERDYLLASIQTRFSTLWAQDPYQQLCYHSGRAWVRLNTPHVLLGVPDSNTESEAQANATRVLRDQGAAMSVNERLTVALQPVRDQIEGKSTPRLVDVLAMTAIASTPKEMENAAHAIASMGDGPDRDKARGAYKDRMAFLKSTHKKPEAETVQHQHTGTVAPPSDNTQREDAPISFTLDQVINALHAAGDVESLNAAADLINQLPSDEDKQTALDEYHALQAKD